MAIEGTWRHSAFRDTAHVDRLKAAVLPWLVRWARRAQDLARRLDMLRAAMAAQATPLKIRMAEGTVRGILHHAESAQGAIVMVGGAGGGVNGPAGIYEELATRLQRKGIAALRLDYRHPNDLDDCVHDVLAAIDFLHHEGVDRVVLLGWSFGGAVVITAGAVSKLVVGVATVASQTYGAHAVAHLSPKSLLLLHGTGDTTLPDSCSRQLYAAAGEPKKLVLYPGDNHGIAHHAADMLDTLYRWSLDLLTGSGTAARGA
jgi:dipeptidyl aminopeptidase/acylaminoacyl peptidase